MSETQRISHGDAHVVRKLQHKFMPTLRFGRDAQTTQGEDSFYCSGSLSLLLENHMRHISHDYMCKLVVIIFHLKIALQVSTLISLVIPFSKNPHFYITFGK